MVNDQKRYVTGLSVKIIYMYHLYRLRVVNDQMWTGEGIKLYRTYWEQELKQSNYLLLTFH